MYYSIDRIEDDYAVLIDDDTDRPMDVLLSELPEGVQEGDIIRLDDNGYTVDEEETRIRREEMADLLRQLMEE